ncbi:hypothetical protein FACS1894123_05790 [Bacteroidia bacterium]|nr:hypothetical protein FACS1894123_05790 [Bacteroidia bacterium]
MKKNTTHDLNLRGGNYYTSTERSLALKDDPFAWKTALWNQTDKYYKEAVTKYEKAKMNIAVNVGAEDRSNDFSVEKPEKYCEKPPSEKANRSGDSRLLVGNYKRNNNSTNQGMMPGIGNRYCLDNDAGGIKMAIWSNLDKKYKNATGAYESKLLDISQKQL